MYYSINNLTQKNTNGHPFNKKNLIGVKISLYQTKVHCKDKMKIIRNGMYFVLKWMIFIQVPIYKVKLDKQYS